MPCTLLLVEDHELSRRALARVLAARGHDVHEATTGEAAIELLANKTFTVVISDLRLPGTVNGLDVLKRQRQNVPGGKRLLLTAFGSAEIRKKTNEIGAIYMEKPISLDQVLSFVAD